MSAIKHCDRCNQLFTGAGEASCLDCRLGADSRKLQSHIGTPTRAKRRAEQQAIRTKLEISAKQALSKEIARQRKVISEIIKIATPKEEYADLDKSKNSPVAKSRQIHTDARITFNKDKIDSVLCTTCDRHFLRSAIESHKYKVHSQLIDGTDIDEANACTLRVSIVSGGLPSLGKRR